MHLTELAQEVAAGVFIVGLVVKFITSVLKDLHIIDKTKAERIKHDVDVIEQECLSATRIVEQKYKGVKGASAEKKAQAIELAIEGIAKHKGVKITPTELDKHIESATYKIS